MDTSLARLKPIPAKFRSLAARIPDVDNWCEQAGRLIMEYINAGGLDDPRYVVTVIRIREAFDGFDRRPGSDDWSGAWHVARQLLLTPEQLAAWEADLGSATPSPKERFNEYYADHCNLMADFLEKDIQRIRAANGVKMAEQPEPARHSPDFRSVHWYGAEYSFTANQAACVKILWEARDNKTPDVSGAYMVETVGVQDSSGRLDQVFRHHSAWGAMIVPGKTKGTYRLKEPAAP